MVEYCRKEGAAVESRRVTVDAREMGAAVSQILAEGGSFVLTVTGNSMRPTLVPQRDQVCLTAPDKLRKGDIVFFRRRSGEYILHRILQVGPEGLTVNGDSQDWTETIQPDQVIGVVSRICRDGKWRDMDSVPVRLYGLLWPATRTLRPGLLQLKQKLRK